MSKSFLYVTAYLPSTACVAAASAIALHGSNGWGWFLFVAAILYPSFRSGGDAD